MIRLQTWFSVAIVAVSAPATAADDMALVTFAEGEVKVDGGAAPPAPFVLDGTAKLTLPEGASVVVLHEGTATRLRGPRTVGLGDLEAPSTGATAATRGALQAVMTRDVSFAKAGASRGGELTLVRPIPGSTVVAPQGFTWRCAGCGEQPVEVYAFLDDAVVWTAKGSDTLRYGGPPLAPGPYLLRVGTREFSFTVADQAHQERVKQARTAADEAMAGLRSQGVDDVAVLISVPAGVYLRSGMPSEALWLVDDALVKHPEDAELKALRIGYERQAGIAAP